MHCLREHEHVTSLEFLRRFFLLVSVGDAGILRYQDTSTGAIVAQHRTRLGRRAPEPRCYLLAALTRLRRCDALCQNPYNGIVLAGHGNGTVTLWSPNMGNPVVSLLAHRGPVRSLAVDAAGRYLVTAGADAQVKVWDVRTFRPLHAYFSATPASAVDVSQRGMLAVAYGPHVQVGCTRPAGLVRRRALTASGRSGLERRVERESICPLPEPPAGWRRHERSIGAILPVRRRAGRRAYQRHLLSPGAAPQPT